MNVEKIVYLIASFFAFSILYACIFYIALDTNPTDVLVATHLGILTEDEAHAIYNSWFISSVIFGSCLSIVTIVLLSIGEPT